MAGSLDQLSGGHRPSHYTSPGNDGVSSLKKNIQPLLAVDLTLKTLKTGIGDAGGYTAYLRYPNPKGSGYTNKARLRGLRGLYYMHYMHPKCTHTR